MTGLPANRLSAEMFDKHRHQKMIATNNRLRALQGVAGTLAYQEWIDLCQHYDFRCVACGLRRPLSIDHVLPLSMGGANTIENVQPLCQFCNGNKGARLIDYRPNPFSVRPALTEENYALARTLRAAGWTNKAIAHEIGISQQAIADLLRGGWRYLDDPKTKR